MQTIEPLSNFTNKIKWLNYIWLTALFALNFTGTPTLKYLYLAYAVFVLICILLLDIRTSIHMIISLSFFEGQGRILWGYHPAARIAFDGLIAIATLRSFVTTKDLKVTDLLPKHMLVLILFHFLWYVVEIFNIDSINIFAALAGTKVYIFPFFLLIFLRQNEDHFDFQCIKEISFLIFFILLGESLLSLYQLNQLENLMLGISPHYDRAMRGGIFTMDKFRPFGTTQLPGAISVFIFLSSGLLLIKEKLSKKYLLSLVPLFSLFFVVLIVCQVRSALLKFGVITTGTMIILLINNKQKLSTLIRISLGSLIIAPFVLIYLYPTIEKYTHEHINLEAGLERWGGIESIDDVTSQRSSIGTVFEVMIDRLQEFPMGLGPAMTGAAGSLSVELVAKDPVYTKHTFWAHDNFYLSLVTEFGYGCIFYLLYILSVPFVLLRYYIKLFQKGDFVNARIAAISFLVICVMLVGNWGAIGIPYNPESFYFWFWTALGFNAYSKSMEGMQLT